MDLFMKFDLKKKSLAFAIILLLILFVIVPSINAGVTKIEEPICLGSIWGNTGTSDTWGFSPVFLQKLKLEVKRHIVALLWAYTE